MMFYTKTKYIKDLTVGKKLWTNSLAIRMDPYHVCTNNCLYCFARGLQKFAMKRNHKTWDPRILKMADTNNIIRKFVRILETGEYDKKNFVETSIERKWFMEIGTMGEPMQECDEEVKSTWNIMIMAQAYEYPIYINTKGNLLIKNRNYFDLFAELPIKVIDITLPSLNDKIKTWERNAPDPGARYKLIKDLAKRGVAVVVSCRPIIKGITDINFEGYIKALCDAGVRSIHLRSLILQPNMMTPWLRSYAKEQGMEKNGWSFRFPKEYILDLCRRADRIARSYNVSITASENLFFNLIGSSPKCVYDKMAPEIQKHLFPFSIIPYLKKIKENADNPQLLMFRDFMQTLPDDSILEQEFIIKEETMSLLDFLCCPCRPRLSAGIKFKNILRYLCWQSPLAKVGIKAKSQMGKVDKINYIIKNNNFVKDREGNVLYIYLPDKLKEVAKNKCVEQELAEQVLNLQIN